MRFGTGIGLGLIAILLVADIVIGMKTIGLLAADPPVGGNSGWAVPRVEPADMVTSTSPAVPTESIPVATTSVPVPETVIESTPTTVPPAPAAASEQIPADDPAVVTAEEPGPGDSFSLAVVDVLLLQAQQAGVPASAGAVVVLAGCFGDAGRSHWGYFNNGAFGGPVNEGGVVVPLDAICLNPAQPDPYSSLLHELGHRYFWNNGLWGSTASAYGGRETAAECFAKIFGATVFGSGGCSDGDAQRMQSEFGW